MRRASPVSDGVADRRTVLLSGPRSGSSILGISPPKRRRLTAEDAEGAEKNREAENHREMLHMAWIAVVDVLLVGTGSVLLRIVSFGRLRLRESDEVARGWFIYCLCLSLGVLFWTGLALLGASLLGGL